MQDTAARIRLRTKQAEFYEPTALADAILDRLEEMEAASDKRPEGSTFRARTGLTCVAEYRGLSNVAQVEDAITAWLAEAFPHAEPQRRDLRPPTRPDIVFGYQRDARGEDVVVVLEAKAVWHRWITSGATLYSNVAVDEFGRCSGDYATGNIAQVVKDRDKLLATYRDPRDRLMLLALVFQRPGELDDRLIKAIGKGWSVRSRHILDLCNPPGDNLGVTAMLFWPTE